MAGDPDDGQHILQVELTPPATPSSRPLVSILVVLAALATLLVVNGRSSAGGERTLRTTDPSPYVDASTLVTFDPSRSPTIPSATALDPMRTTVVPPVATSTSTTAVAVVSPPVLSPDPTATAVPVAPVDSASTMPPAPPPAGAGDGGDGGVSRSIPDEASVSTAPLVVSPWADKTAITSAGYVATDVGCAAGTSASALDAFFRDRVGPAIGFDYQHVYACLLYTSDAADE